MIGPLVSGSKNKEDAHLSDALDKGRQHRTGTSAAPGAVYAHDIYTGIFGLNDIVHCFDDNGVARFSVIIKDF